MFPLHAPETVIVFGPCGLVVASRRQGRADGLLFIAIHGEFGCLSGLGCRTNRYQQKECKNTSSLPHGFSSLTSVSVIRFDLYWTFAHGDTPTAVTPEIWHHPRRIAVRFMMRFFCLKGPDTGSKGKAG